MAVREFKKNRSNSQQIAAYAFRAQSEAVLDDTVRHAENLTPIDSKGVDQLKAYIQKMGTTETGYNGKVARSAARFLAYSDEGSDLLDAAMSEAEAVGLQDFSRIKTKADLEQRRKIVRNVLEKNLTLRQRDLNRENFMRETAREEGLTPAEAEGFLKWHLDRQHRTLPISLRVRDADHELMTTYLAIFDLFEREWGNWQIHPGGAISFKTPVAHAAYGGYIAAAQKACAERQQASRENVTAILVSAKELQQRRVSR